MSENFSYSKIDTYEQCKFKFKLKYLDGHYLFSGSVATEFGTLIHKTEENIANFIRAGEAIDYPSLKNNIIVKMAEIESRYPADFSEKDKSDRTYKDKMYEYLDDKIYRLERFMKAHPTYEIVGTEQDFKVAYNDKYVFKGFIDRVIHDKATNRYLIQDIKTWPAPAEADELATPLQFVFYTMAVEDLYKCDKDHVSCEYDLPFCDGNQPAGSPGYMTRGMKKLEKLFGGIESGDWEPNPTPLCHWCEYNPMLEKNKVNLDKAGPTACCPYFSLWDHKGDSRYKESLLKWGGDANIDSDQKILQTMMKQQKGKRLVE